MEDTPVPPLEIGNKPATSEVAKSTASVVEPVPSKTFASIVPPPNKIEEPEPTVIVAVEFVPVEIKLKGTEASEETTATHWVPL